MTITWRGDEPRLTAADVKAVIFPSSAWGRRGYDQAAVDAFLDRVERELVMCANEVTDGQAEILRLRRRFLEEGRGGEVSAGAEEAHAMAVAIVSEAHVTADRYVADAQAYSARLTEDAMALRKRILAEAEQVLADARAQARAAADAALDEPVPDQARDLLRASRASDAYGRTFNSVHLGAALPLSEALYKVLRNWHEQAGAGTGEAGEARQAG